MKLKRANEIIKEAKRNERKMGTSFYKTVTNVDTGDRKIVPVYQHGMPHSDFPNSSTPFSKTFAVLTGLASIAAVGYSGIQLQKSKIGNAEINKKQKRSAALLLISGVVGFTTLAPWKYELVQSTNLSGQSPYEPMFTAKSNQSTNGS